MSVKETAVSVIYFLSRVSGLMFQIGVQGCHQMKTLLEEIWQMHFSSLYSYSFLRAVEHASLQMYTLVLLFYEVYIHIHT